jgi:hypothetical protein
LGMGLWLERAARAVVALPEAAVNEDNLAPRWESRGVKRP